MDRLMGAAKAYSDAIQYVSRGVIVACIVSYAGAFCIVVRLVLDWWKGR